jgi:RNA polymerase sigma-70 factor (ECF subfamily)
MQSKFEQLYDMYYDCVYKYIFVSVKNKLNTEDIMATVFTRIFEVQDKITEVKLAKSWIFRIAQDCIIDFYIKNNEVIPNENFLHMQNEKFQNEGITLRDELTEVKKAMDKLPEDSKKILYLRFYGGLDFREIAETVNIAETTVKSIIFRAIKKIKENHEYTLGDNFI